MNIKFTLLIFATFLTFISFDCSCVEYDIISLNPKGQEKEMVARGAQLAKDGTVVGTLHSYHADGTPKTSIFIYKTKKDYQVLSFPFLDENTELTINNGDLLAGFSQESNILFTYNLSSKELKQIDPPINAEGGYYQYSRIVGMTKNDQIIVEMNPQERDVVAQIYDCTQSKWLNPVFTYEHDTLVTNSRGQVVGHHPKTPGAKMWFYDAQKGLTDLDYEDTSDLEPEVLSENGVIFGYCPKSRNGFYWTAEKGVQFINPTGTKHIVFLSPRCSNKNGQAVFRGVHKNRENAYMIDINNGSVVDLKSLGGMDSWPWSINNKMQVVGEFEIKKDDLRAFIWDPKNKMRDLNDLIPANSGWVLNWAIDINDQGSIIGYGIHKKRYQSFLLIPKKTLKN